MDNVRLILFVTLAFLLLLTYQAWQQDYGPRPGQAPSSTAGDQAGQTGAPGSPGGSNEVPRPVADDRQDAPGGDASLPGASAERLIASEGRVVVKTDALRVELDTRGGDIRVVDLLNYPVSEDEPDQPFRLMDDQLPHIFITQSGLLAKELGPTHQQTYQSARPSYRLEPGEDRLEVILDWEGPAGVKVEKIYRFQRGSHVIGLSHRIHAGEQPWEGRLYGQLQRTESDRSTQESSFIYTYTGGAFASPQSRYHKVDFGEIREAGTNANLSADGGLARGNVDGWENGWIAMLQHYFVSALVPDPAAEYHYYTKYLQQGHRYVLGGYGPIIEIPAGQSRELSMTLYAGPKLQHVLEDLSPGLDLTVDYGWLWFLAKPLFWLLEKLHALLGNWGWAIVVLTLLIKLAFFHLSATSYKSMAQMRKLQPRLQSLKERYADDKAGLNQAMMDMYRKEKINPLGGCLPILVQIPVFIALYWVLLESVELRQADFIFWIDDLSTKDPYFILPLIMGATMFIQQYLTPAPLDPVQQKVMMVLPVVFTVFFAFFPSGLVLYWLVNNVLSIAQQWYITKKIENEGTPLAKK